MGNDDKFIFLEGDDTYPKKRKKSTNQGDDNNHSDREDTDKKKIHPDVNLDNTDISSSKTNLKMVNLVKKMTTTLMTITLMIATLTNQQVLIILKTEIRNG